MASTVSQFEYMKFDDFEELLLDKPADERWELINGRVIRGMVGARWEHNIVCQNIAFALRSHFKATKRPCRVFQETFYVKRRETDFAVLPDVVVRCGPMEPGATSVSDPVAVFEVLSPGTEGRDRYEKWNGYKQLPSLQYYALVARDTPRIELKTRAGDIWQAEDLEGLDRTLRLPSLDFEIGLAEVYEDVISA